MTYCTALTQQITQIAMIWGLKCHIKVLLSCKPVHCLQKLINFLMFLSVNLKVYGHYVTRMTNIKLHSLAVLMTKRTDISLFKKKSKSLIISDKLQVWWMKISQWMNNCTALELTTNVILTVIKTWLKLWTSDKLKKKNETRRAEAVLIQSWALWVWRWTLFLKTFI